MPISKICSRCGRMSPSGTKCMCIAKTNAERNRKYDQTRRDKKSKRFYDSKEWIDKRDMILRADAMDVYVYMTEKRIIPADTVHHIIPLRDDFNKRLNASNLMSLSHDTHSRIERMYKDDKQGMITTLSTMLKEFRAVQKINL